MANNTYPVQLTGLESLYLSDSISMFMQGPPDGLQGQVSPYPNLLLKIGGAVLETDQQNNPVSVYFSLPELWIIREVTRSSVVIGTERVGFSLLVKTYKAILELVAECDPESVASVMRALGEVTENEPGKDQHWYALDRWRRGQQEEEGGDNDDQPNGPDQDRPND